LRPLRVQVAAPPARTNAASADGDVAARVTGQAWPLAMGQAWPLWSAPPLAVAPWAMPRRLY
jgi:hypothetical protein